MKGVPHTMQVGIEGKMNVLGVSLDLTVIAFNAENVNVRGNFKE